MLSSRCMAIKKKKKAKAKSKKKAKKKSKAPSSRSVKSSVILSGCAVDPLLVGADKEFLDGFPRKLIQESACLPLRKYRGAGLIVARNEKEAVRFLPKLQRSCDVRLMVVTALHDYGIDLFLRYWEGADHRTAPPLWIPEARRSYVNRLSDTLSVSGKIQPVPVITSLLLSSPLASRAPVLVTGLGQQGHAMFLHGMAGLKLGVRFSSKWIKPVHQRLNDEFDMEAESADLVEGKGRREKGLDDLSGLSLPPLKSPSFIIEPRIRRRS